MRLWQLHHRPTLHQAHMTHTHGGKICLLRCPTISCQMMGIQAFSHINRRMAGRGRETWALMPKHSTNNDLCAWEGFIIIISNAALPCPVETGEDKNIPVIKTRQDSWGDRVERNKEWDDVCTWKKKSLSKSVSTRLTHCWVEWLYCWNCVVWSCYWFASSCLQFLITENYKLLGLDNFFVTVSNFKQPFF